MGIPSEPDARPGYLDPARPTAERVQDLIGRLTLAEKIGQLCNATPGILRLGIPPYDYWNEALHGVARNGRATVFPAPIGMAATWNPALIQQIASAIGDEGRAKYHAALRKNGGTGIYQGLTFWSPNVNIFRDPRWGRGQETWGEDPYLTGELAGAFVRGLQGDHPVYLKATACAKHYAVHSGPEKDRHTFNAVVSLRDLHDTYLPAFKKLVVEDKVEAVMGAYNRTLGEPCCASGLLLADILRGEWGFTGHVVSDCGAINDIHAGHQVTRDAAESAALAVKMGCDLSCICTYEHLGEAVARGLIGEAEIDRALARLLTTRFKLGMFDPDDMVPFAAIPLSVVGCPGHRELAYRAALEAVVLLKNRDGILPLRDTLRSLLVVGPTATSCEALLGNYHGLADRLVTLLEGIVGAVPEGVKIEYRMGTPLAHKARQELDWSIYDAAASDVTIACMGLTPMLEGEEGDAILAEQNGDRADIGLPEPQVTYLKHLAAHGARIVLVLTGGSPIALGELADLAAAIIFVWYPGQEGGRAVADVLFGKASPSGKLPITFPKSVAQLPPFADYDMRDRTYRYATWEPLFPFGFGLSYTRFTYSDLRLSAEQVSAGESVKVTCTLHNIGPVAGAEVAQCYLSDLAASTTVPRHKLVGFRRVTLQPGERTEVEFEITPAMMALIADDGRPVLEPGAFRVTVGGCSPSERGLALGAPAPQTAQFMVTMPF
ncbi:MAG: glycoside hydrolase family 3 C-terminal domain-containing protein [Anaerolineae bacterium]